MSQFACVPYEAHSYNLRYLSQITRCRTFRTAWAWLVLASWPLHSWGTHVSKHVSSIRRHTIPRVPGLVDTEPFWPLSINQV